MAGTQRYCFKVTYDPSRRIPWRASVVRTGGTGAWYAYAATEFNAKSVVIEKMRRAGEPVG